jgi:hypothetical protein
MIVIIWFLKHSQKVVMVMYQIEDRSEKVFHNQDLVLWHSRADKRSLPIPAVVVRQQDNNVIIRARVEGKVREITVSPDELVER